MTAREPGGSGTAQDQPAKSRKVQELLDEALADSFPASDPISIVTSQEEEDWGEDTPQQPPAPDSSKAP